MHQQDSSSMTDILFDHGRCARIGLPEAVFSEGKSRDALLRLLENVPVCGFSGTGETVTPTALALLKALEAEFGAWPCMTVQQTVISYGSKVFPHAPNGALWALGMPI